MTKPNIPLWTIPNTAGQLSNKRGSNTSTDALTMQVKYVNPAGTADPPGTMRIVGTRIVSSGAAQFSEQVWDTGWFGNSTTNPIPGVTVSFTVAGVYAGRVYWVAFGGYGVYSAPVTGGSIGPYRRELSVPQLNNPQLYPLSAYIVSGVLYVELAPGGANPTSFRIAYSTITPDGTLGAWATTTTYSVAPGMLCGSGSYLYSIGGVQTAKTSVSLIPLDAFGVPGTLAVQNTLPGALADHGVGYDPTEGYVYAVGGDNGTAPSAAAYYASVGASGTLGGWLTGGALPTAVTGGTFFLWADTTPGNNSKVNAVYAGGSTTMVASGVTNQVQLSTGANIRASSAWTAGTVMASGVWFAGGAVSLDVRNDGAKIGNTMLVLGGTLSSGATTTITQVSTLGSGGNGTWATGVGAALATSNMGTGGSVAVSGDGSQLITFDYEGPQSPTVGAALGDGDQIQFTVQVTDNTSGFASPIAYTIVKIGQPPTIASTVPANASTPAGAFTATMNYLAGTGGAAEASFRIQEQQPNGTTIADSGTLQGNANSFATRAALALANTQIPASAATGSVVFTVTSADVPMPGSSNTATVTNTTTYTGSAPGTPTAVTALADNVNGLITVGWTSGINTATNRIWYRPSGTTAWLLAKDNVTSTGAAQTLQIMEPLGISTPYDFSVSGVSADPVEGVRSSVVSNVIIVPNGSPLANQFDAGGWHVILSVVGNGVAQHSTIFLTDGKLVFDRKIASETAQLFGATAPSVRYGIFDYQTVVLNLIQRIQDIAGLEAVLGATLTSGATLCLRDSWGTGRVLYCYLPEPRKYTDDLYRDYTLTLVQTQFTFTP